jgi:alcohol dehydrogenase class IV
MNDLDCLGRGAGIVIPPSSRTIEAAADLSASTTRPSSQTDRLNTGPHGVFTFPNRIIFGAGKRATLETELNRLGIKRPLVVTDAGLAASGLLSESLASVASAVVFQGVQGNPTEADVLSGLEVYHAKRCDGLIGLGGGSPIDAAKAIRLLATHPGRLADYDYTQGGLDRITPDLPPMLAVPTTAGTGSEAGRGTLIQLPQTRRKTIVMSPYLLPSTAICDPDLTRALPPGLTAGTGMDALSHCVESFLATTFHPICDGIAVEGLRYVFKGLETAVREGTNLEARTAMMAGALMGAISFHKGLGVVHSLSHALGSEGRVHHGTLNAILLPHALRFNREAAEGRMSELACRVGLGRGGDGAGHLITMAELVLARLPLPRRLGDLDALRSDRIADYARLAMLDHCHRTNPRPCAQTDMEDLLERAW